MSELIREGVTLMVMGMGTVFVFLTVLVFGTTIMSQIIMRIPANNEMDNAPQRMRPPEQDNLAEVAAVAAAVKVVHKH
jgi:oxaloacetate decarboxylase gamma subunit